MSRFFLVPLFASVVAFAADGEPAAPVAPAARARVVSSETAERLSAAAPKYTPPPAKETPGPAPAAATPVADKPRNTIIRLPAYVVQEQKVPALRERDLLTPQGRVDLALKRHPGLRFGSLGPLNNNVWANAMLEEEFGIERQRELWELTTMGSPGPRKPPTFTGRPPFSLPIQMSGPWGGLVVPWEKR